jgi:transcriptional regulator with XRE-family HTH domain
VRLLFEAEKKSSVQLARDMGRATFQSTLHKIMSGVVASPTRSSAERIARYFKIPIDALYDEATATQVAKDRGLDTPRVAEPIAEYRVHAPAPRHQFAAPLLRRLNLLDDAQWRNLEAVVEAHLNAIAPIARRSSPQTSGVSRPARIYALPPRSTTPRPGG